MDEPKSFIISKKRKIESSKNQIDTKIDIENAWKQCI